MRNSMSTSGRQALTLRVPKPEISTGHRHQPQPMTNLALLMALVIILTILLCCWMVNRVLDCFADTEDAHD